MSSAVFGCKRAFLARAGVTFQGFSRESLSAIKESSWASALNIDLLSSICQRSTANKPFSGHLARPLNVLFIYLFAARGL